MEINKLTTNTDRTSSLREADGGQKADAARALDQETSARSSGVEAPDGQSVQLSAIAQVLAGATDLQSTTSDVDLNRVQAIRSAIEQGTYHVDPQRLAANFVDLEHQLFG